MDRTVVEVCSGVAALVSPGGKVDATPSVSGARVDGQLYHSGFTCCRFVIISDRRQFKAERLDTRCLSALLPLTKERTGFAT
jgi:hypothetical protein